ncbi:hypothetical protein TNCT6_41640 [Streptomyces sp. 6-11-2]|nr:hypothetical protein TNCT6_41640 [Streptomyces sp. 6-11-2]
MRLLEGVDEVRPLSRAALGAGAEYDIWPEGVLPRRVVPIYERRERVACRSGQPSVGFEEAIDALRVHQGEKIATGFVDGRNRGGYYFQLFLDAGLNRILAVFGIKPSPARGSLSGSGAD